METKIEKAIRAKLLADATFLAACGGRLYLRPAPQNPAPPYAVYFLVDQGVPITHDAKLGPFDARIQVSGFSALYSEARAIAEAAQRALLGLRVTTGGVIVQGVFDAGLTTVYDPNVTLKLHHVAADFRVKFQSAA